MQAFGRRDIMKRTTLGEKIFNIFNYILMVLLVLITIYPVWYVAVASFSSGEAVSTGKVMFWIKDFTFEAYRKVFATKNLGTAYMNTIYYATVGTLVSMILTTTAAFGLSRKSFPFKKQITLFFMFTSWFSAGIMPTYINIRNLGLLDTRLGIILMGAVSTWNLILMRSYFESIPQEMDESARLDGATNWELFKSIYLPLSGPALATISLYYFVGSWNAYFWSMLILTDEKKIPLQVILKKLIVELNMNFSETAGVDFTSISRETTVFATIMISMVPMLILYPFIQKYFVKGIMIGAVKG